MGRPRQLEIDLQPMPEPEPTPVQTIAECFADLPPDVQEYRRVSVMESEAAKRMLNRIIGGNGRFTHALQDAAVILRNAWDTLSIEEKAERFNALALSGREHGIEQGFQRVAVHKLRNARRAMVRSTVAANTVQAVEKTPEIL